MSTTSKIDFIADEEQRSFFSSEKRFKSSDNILYASLITTELPLRRNLYKLSYLRIFSHCDCILYNFIA